VQGGNVQLLRFYFSPHCSQKERKRLEKSIALFESETGLRSKIELWEEFKEEIECGWIIPIFTEIKKAKKQKILVVEPHPDDGVYSAGGTLLSMAQKGYPVTDLCLFSKSEDEELMRHKENKLVWEDIFNSETEFTQLSDALYRGLEDAQNVRMHTEFRTFLVVRRVLEEIIHHKKPEIVLGPLGVGLHIDHLLVNLALLNIWKAKEKFDLWLYEDFPYCNENRYHYIKALTDMQKEVRLSAKYIDITKQIEDKVSLQMLYLSQHKYSRSQLYKILSELGSAICLEGKWMCEKVISGHFYERIWWVHTK